MKIPVICFYAPILLLVITPIVGVHGWILAYLVITSNKIFPDSCALISLFFQLFNCLYHSVIFMHIDAFRNTLFKSSSCSFFIAVNIVQIDRRATKIMLSSLTFSLFLFCLGCRLLIIL